MKKMISIAVAALLLPVAAFAAPPNMEPGLWEQAMTMGAHSFTNKECVTPDMVKDGPESLLNHKDEMAGNCKSSGNWSGNVYRFKVDCSAPEQGGTVSTTGTMTYESPRRMLQVVESTTTIDGAKQSMTMKVDHKRIGDCPK